MPRDRPITTFGPVFAFQRAAQLYGEEKFGMKAKRFLSRPLPAAVAV